MLRITARKGGKSAAAYYLLDDAGRKAEGQWFGKLAEEMGLTGTVDHAKFAALADNIDFRTDRLLTGRDDDPKKRNALFDLTFIEPKSFTMMRHVAGDERLEDVRREALFEVAALVEQDMQVQWRSGNERTTVQTGNMVAAAWFHETARPSKEDGKADFYGHCHLTVINATKRGERIQSADFRFKNNDYYSAEYSSRLAEKTAALGYGIRTKGKYWEIDGVSNGLIGKFSRREQDTDAYKVQKIAEWTEMKERGEKLTKAQAFVLEHGFTGKAASQSAASSRGGKKYNGELPELQDYWRSRLNESESASLLALRDQASVASSPPMEEVKPGDAERKWQKLRDQQAAMRRPGQKEKEGIAHKKVAAAMLRDLFGRAKPEQVHQAIAMSKLKQFVHKGVSYLSRPSGTAKPAKKKRSAWDRIVDRVKGVNQRARFDRIKAIRQQVPAYGPVPMPVVQVPRQVPQERKGIAL